MFYVVLLVCSGLLTKTCTNVILPGEPFATMQLCNDAGKLNNLNPQKSGDVAIGWVCLQRPKDAP